MPGPPAASKPAGARRCRLARPGDDIAALVQGFRSLFVAFLIKGLAMLLVVGFGILFVAAMFLGLGRGLF